ncbi:MAG: TolC family protein [Desulfobacteraceae bacterium]|jgi:TolC family type I secretion outer membrane protein
MRIFKLLLPLCCGAVLWASASTAATEEIPQPLTFNEAMAAAVKHNPQVVAARFAVEAAASQVISARSGLLPQFYLSETFNYTNSPLWAFGTTLNQGVIQSSDFSPDALNDPDAVQNFNTALSMSWRLFDGGQTRTGWRQAIEGKEATELGLLRLEQQVIAQAGKAYVGLLLAGENLEVITQSLETSRAHLKLVEDRFRSGLAIKSDVLRAQVRIADLEQQRLWAESQVQVAQVTLNAAMGQEQQSAFAPSTRLELCIPPKGDMAHWMDLALRQRPDLKQLDLQKTIAQRGVKRAKAGHLPTLALQGNYEINSEDFNDTHDNYSLGAVVRVNLYSGQRISSQAAAAKAKVSQAEAIQNSLALAVRVDTQRAFYQARSAWQSISVARQAVGQAEEGLRIVSNRYAGGLLTIVDLLDAQVALQQARTQNFKALHDYKVARIELAFSTGTIDKDFN